MTDLVADFNRLRLYGMASGYAEYREHILVATDRALRSVRYRMRAQPTHNRAMAVRRARHREPGAQALPRIEEFVRDPVVACSDGRIRRVRRQLFRMSAHVVHDDMTPLRASSLLAS
jgi:hypothetical protein